MESLEDLLGKTVDNCPCGRPHRIPTREAHLQPGSLQRLPEMAERLLAPGTLLCVADTNTWAAAGERAAEMLRENGKTVDVHFVDRRIQPAHADRETVDTLAAAIRRTRAAAVMAVGSGTINDVAKSAATLVERPLVTVATAASMNGYPSAISALTVDGVKTTEPCRPPVGIVADPEILATAPGRMTGAGFGDLLSKNASTADWMVSHALDGEYYCSFSAAVAEEAVNRCIENAGAIRENRVEGLGILAEGLLRSGVSMVIAGSSAPASGGEHLISHLWDMTAHWSGRKPALHGEQTGVTTLISLKLYEKILALDAATLRKRLRERPAESPAAFTNRMRDLFRDIAESILPFARQKYLDGPALQERRKRILARWEKVRRAVASVAIPAETSRAHLESAGAVSRAADLGISHAELVFAYRNARWIRNRYTVLDLVDELGVLEEWQEEVLAGV